MKYEKEGYLKWLPGKLRPAMRNFRVLNSDYGHFRSVRKKGPVDRDGNPIPWYTYPAIEYVKQFDLTGRNIFEYGAGYSSLFYASRCGHITSVEDNPKWFERVKAMAPANCEIVLAETREKYIGAINRTSQTYDVIIVDGIYREECCEVVLPRIQECGMFILDNSDVLPECVRRLAKLDFIQVDMAGFGPLNGYVWATSFFLSRKFNFKSRQAHRPTLSVGP